jgi:tetratricopeptide (TPR) repeat protein
MQECKRNLVLLILLVFFYTTPAQQLTSSSIIQEIDAAIAGFNYDQADHLIEVALEHIDSYDYTQQQHLYTYAALRKFQQGDQLRTEEYFLRILEINPTFTLDPVSMSPKMVSLFQTTKVEYLEKITLRLSQLEKDITYNPVPWRSLVFPGWEQWHRNYRLKGSLWAVAGTACLIGTLQAVIRTQNKKMSYQEAKSPEEVNALYRDYNHLYKSQFYWSYAYLTIWLASHLDALFFTPVSKAHPFTYIITPNQVSIALHYRF